MECDGSTVGMCSIRKKGDGEINWSLIFSGIPGKALDDLDEIGNSFWKCVCLKELYPAYESKYLTPYLPFVKT